mgnify:CR=1 FL=1
MLMVDCFAHATGLLLLPHTGRIRMFGASGSRTDGRIRARQDLATQQGVTPCLRSSRRSRCSSSSTSSPASMPSIDQVRPPVKNAKRLIDMAELIDVPDRVHRTEREGSRCDGG